MRSPSPAPSINSPTLNLYSIHLSQHAHRRPNRGVNGPAMDPSPSSTSRELKDTRATSSTSIASAASSSSGNANTNNNTASHDNNHRPPSLPQRTPSSSSINKSAHRQSFAEGLRNTPSSPRSHRHPSFTQAAVQELLNHPPAANKHANPKFAGRDWVDVAIGELVSSSDVRWVELDSTIEEATMVSSRFNGTTLSSTNLSSYFLSPFFSSFRMSTNVSIS